ncbi:MAG: gamma-glutamylcyclotransferase [Verrucomicrobiales bacterium]|nr:gamma-glutamylcyclotransferase [Verrucomicrobiales bacterium]
MNLFVYGTLLFPEIRNLVGRRQFQAADATLEGFEIYRVKNAAYPGIVEQDGGTVPGQILRHITPAEIDFFDQYEDDFYQRITVAVTTPDESVISAECYAVPSITSREILTKVVWTADWFTTNHYADFLNRLKSFG